MFRKSPLTNTLFGLKPDRFLTVVTDVLSFNSFPNKYSVRNILVCGDLQNSQIERKSHHAY